MAYTVPDHEPCKPGRFAPKRKFGRGLPTQTHSAGQDNLAGIASTCLRPKQTVQTEQGPIALAFGPEGDVSWTPTTAALSVAPYADSRRTAISDRYYR